MALLDNQSIDLHIFSADAILLLLHVLHRAERRDAHGCRDWRKCILFRVIALSISHAAAIVVAQGRRPENFAAAIHEPSDARARRRSPRVFLLLLLDIVVGMIVQLVLLLRTCR